MGVTWIWCRGIEEHRRERGATHAGCRTRTRFYKHAYRSRVAVQTAMQVGPEEALEEATQAAVPAQGWGAPAPLATERWAVM